MIFSADIVEKSICFGTTALSSVTTAAQLFLCDFIHTYLKRIHSQVQQPCKFIATKKSDYIRKELNSHGIGLLHQHGHRFIVFGTPICEYPPYLSKHKEHNALAFTLHPLRFVTRALTVLAYAVMQRSSLSFLIVCPIQFHLRRLILSFALFTPVIS